MFFEFFADEQSRGTGFRGNKDKNMFTQIETFKYRFRNDICMEFFVQVDVIYFLEEDVFVYNGGLFVWSDRVHSVSEGRVGDVDSLFAFSQGGFDGVFLGEDFDSLVFVVCFVVTSFFIFFFKKMAFFFENLPFRLLTGQFSSDWA